MMRRGRGGVAWAEVVAILVIGGWRALQRIVTWRELYAPLHSRLLAMESEAIYDERRLSTLDRFVPHKEASSTPGQDAFGEFQLDSDLLLYDVTSTYFEGWPIAIAKRGYRAITDPTACR